MNQSLNKFLTQFNRLCSGCEEWTIGTCEVCEESICEACYEDHVEWTHDGEQK